MESNIEQAYLKHKNLKLAAEELGMKWQTLYVRLRKAGIPVTGDKARYGSDKDRLAAKAEAEFKKLVPFSISKNEEEFQSKIDFMVGNEKVDVKASRLRQGCKRFAARRWAFSVKKQEFFADFVVCFGLLDEGYKVFLIPGELIRNYQTISIPESKSSKSKWKQYEIAADELEQFFKELMDA